MLYDKVVPAKSLASHVRSIWRVDSEGDRAINREKIIPDGYPEIIFHYGDAFRANISGTWYLQNRYLIAGQITNHFFLENTGVSGILGVKFQPWAIKKLFDIEMNQLVNQVIDFPDRLQRDLISLIEVATSSLNFPEKVIQLEQCLWQRVEQSGSAVNAFQKTVELMIESKGTKSLTEIRDLMNISERGLERYFQSHIGLSPKRFCRIIRFSNIFNLVRDRPCEWTEISFLAGFYDQSHFIKNFKEFTGEEPSKYGFNEVNMANLFLNS